MRSARMMFTLPKPLVAELEKYARAVRGGNKSGFVADAVRSYISYMHRQHQTDLARQGYAAGAKKNLEIAREWEPLDNEMWARLDAREKKE